ISTKPRRALVTPEDPEPRSRIPTVLLATTVVSALVVGLAYLVFGPRTNMTEPSPGVTSAPAPTNSTSAAAPTSPPTTPPAPEPSPTQSPPPTDSAPLPSPNPTTSLAPGASPTDPTEPAKPEDEPGGTALPAGTI